MCGAYATNFQTPTPPLGKKRKPHREVGLSDHINFGLAALLTLLTGLLLSAALLLLAGLLLSALLLPTLLLAALLLLTRLLVWIFVHVLSSPTLV
jgi:hypothetical protein